MQLIHSLCLRVIPLFDVFIEQTDNMGICFKALFYQFVDIGHGFIPE